ncbi:MAG: prolipoprotein diacylglyceryl transferase, partial [Planctomycetota bacterium]
MIFTLADAWLHDLSGVIAEIGPLTLRWYGVSYLAAFVLGYLQLRWLAGRGLVAVPVDRVLDAMIWLVLGVMIGGRLGYVIFYQPALFIDFTSNLPFWGVLSINRGGMASHGGIVGVILACWRISRGFTDDEGNRVGACPPLHIMDALALIAPVGLLLGRLANFVNGELLGRVVARPSESGPAWSVRFPSELTERWDELPDDQRVAVAEAAGVPAQLVLQRDEEAEGFVIDWVLARIDDLQAGSADAAAVLEQLLNARHPSQLYQAFAEGLVVGVVVWLVAKSRRHPGVIGGWFLITYGLGRIATELFRLPDAHLATQRLLGLSRGQWLSVGMVVAGVVLLQVVA